MTPPGGFATRLRGALSAAGLLTRELVRESVDGGSGVTPPPRDRIGVVSPEYALTMSDVYRALSIHSTSASQLGMTAWRGGQMMAEPPALVRRPSLTMSRARLIEETVLAMAGAGEAYWRVTRRDDSDPRSPVVDVRPLPPRLVVPEAHPGTGAMSYSYAGEPGHRPRQYAAHQVKHLKLMARTGELHGLGPIQAAQTELRGALELRDYSSLWFSESGVPNGTLTTDQQLTPERAAAYKQAWDANASHGTRVLGHGLKYLSNILSPRDAQFLESRQFTVVQMARLFGLPASLMLAVMEGNSQSYANVEQDWIGYIRFSLMQYLGEIETALGELLSYGTTVKFTVETLLRSDTKTRYEAHEIAIRAGFLTINEVREIEGRAPLSAPARPALPVTSPEGEPDA